MLELGPQGRQSHGQTWANRVQCKFFVYVIFNYAAKCLNNCPFFYLMQQSTLSSDDCSGTKQTDVQISVNAYTVPYCCRGWNNLCNDIKIFTFQNSKLLFLHKFTMKPMFLVTVFLVLILVTSINATKPNVRDTQHGIGKYVYGLKIKRIFSF